MDFRLKVLPWIPGMRFRASLVQTNSNYIMIIWSRQFLMFPIYSPENNRSNNAKLLSIVFRGCFGGRNDKKTITSKIARNMFGLHKLDPCPIVQKDIQPSLVSQKQVLHSHAKWPWHVFTRGVFGNRFPSILGDEFAITIQDDKTWDALDFEGLVQLRQSLLVHLNRGFQAGRTGMGHAKICQNYWIQHLTQIHCRSLALKSTANHGCSLKYSLKESSSLSPVTKTTSIPFAFKSSQELWVVGGCKDEFCTGG